MSETLAGEFIASARAMEGLTSYAAGLRVDDDAARFVIATTWQGVSDVVRQTHGLLDQPARPLLDYMTGDGPEHYELVGEPVPIHVATPNAVVRVARMRIRQNREEEFYAAVRHGLADVQATGNLLAYHLGRRVEGEHVAAAVSVWRSVDALGRHVAPAAGAPLWAGSLEHLLDEFEVEHFDAVEVSGS